MINNSPYFACILGLIFIYYFMPINDPKTMEQLIAECLPKDSVETMKIHEIELPTSVIPVKVKTLARRQPSASDKRIDRILDAIIEVESEGENHRTSCAGARGICQIKRSTWNETTRRMGVRWPYDKDVWNVWKNRMVGRAYLVYLLKIFKGNEHKAIMAYIQGPDGGHNYWYLERVENMIK